jgi:hypothetical protein
VRFDTNSRSGRLIERVARASCLIRTERQKTASSDLHGKSARLFLRRYFFVWPDFSSVVIIPQNYEEMPERQRKQTIPICIPALDSAGRRIAPEWFHSGVAPVRKELVRIARFVLGDPWCASELAETTVHRLWARHGDAIGRYPARRVLKKAMWIAQELKVSDWRMRKHPKLYLALNAMDQKIQEQILTDSTQRIENLERELMLDSIDERLRLEHRSEMRLVFQLVRQGHSWQEIAGHIGDSNPEPVKRRFYRWLRRVKTA